MKEEKELLIKDLCSRLPYGVKGQCEMDTSYDTSFDTISQTHKFDAVVYSLKADLLFVTPLIEDKDEQEFADEEVADGVNILDFKPYLFPLESMSEEQKDEFDRLYTYDALIVEPQWKLIDFCNKHHLDYRGLIPMGLANDATGLNIY